MTQSSFECEVVAARELAADIRELRLRRADGQPLRYEPGQHVVVHAAAGADCCYSICNPPRADGEFAICVRYEASACTREVFARELGDRLRASGPAGALTLVPAPRDLLLVATGTGVAPFHAMIEQLEQRTDGDRVWLLHGARRPAELLFAADWRALADRKRSFSYHPTISRPTSSDLWREPVGRVTALVNAVLRQLRPQRTTAYLCGLPRMIDDVRAQLLGAGLSPAAVRTE